MHNSLKTAFVVLLTVVSLSFSSGKALAAEPVSCPAHKYSAGSVVSSGNEVVARYGTQHGSPGTFSIKAREEIHLTGESVCDDGSWWWKVNTTKREGWIPEDGAFSLTERQTSNRSTTSNQSSVQGVSTSSDTGRCAALSLPNLAPGTRIIQILSTCLSLRSSPVVQSGNVVGTAHNGSRFRLATDPITNWFLITVPGLGDVWAQRGVNDSLSRQIQ